MRSLFDILRGTAKVTPSAMKARMRFVGAKALRLRGRVAAAKVRAFSGSAYNGGIMYPELTVNGIPEDGPVVLDLDSLSIPLPQCPVLDNHDERPGEEIGQVTAIAVRKSDYTLPVNGVLYTDKPRTAPVLEAADGGREWQLSVGTENFALQRVAAGQQCRVNGRNFMGPLTVVRNAVLTDVSFVELGGDDTTWATLAARRALARARGRMEPTAAATKRLVDAIRRGRSSKPTA